MTPQDMHTIIYDEARQAGFDLCGIAPLELDALHVDSWRNWLAQGRHGAMRYMERSERADITTLALWAKSVICLGLNYWLPEALRGTPSDTISIYAQGKDYHEVMKAKMEQLIATLRERLLLHSQFELEAKVYVDTGPLLERAYAEAAGLGWIGKNTCLINQQRGSWFFLAEILTNLDLAPEDPAPDRCGSCTRCLDACPTGAFVAPYQLDARKCISYQTIELRGAIPEGDRAGMGGHIFGCDICQEVCPWNAVQERRRATASQVTEFLPLSVLQSEPDALLNNLARLATEDFRKGFHGSAIKRTKHQGLLRNVAVALGNVGDDSALPALQKLAASDDPIVSEHASWAIRRIGSRSKLTQPA